MRALTIRQPWASLIANGTKTIETRGWQTSYRGPLLIHAAATTKGFDTLPGDCEGTTEGGWRYGYIGDYQAAYCYRTSDEGQRGDTYLHLDHEAEPGPCPLGAVVATCTLADVVPVGSLTWFRQQRLVKGRRCEWWRTAMDGPDVDWCASEDQRPYGDFSPGRYAWLLTDVRPLTSPVPAKGRQGLWTPDADLIAAVEAQR